MTVALPWSSVGLATGYCGSRRVSTLRDTALRCTLGFHGKCHGCGHGACRGSVRGNLRGTRRGNPRKYHGNCHGIFHDHLHVNRHGIPRQSTTNATAFHFNCQGNPPGASGTAIGGSCHGTPRQLPRQFPRTSIHCNLHGKRRQSAAIRGNFHGITALHGICHGNFQHTAISTANYDFPWRLPPHVPR